MGTTELVLPKIIEILGPGGEYEKRRVALRGEYSAVVAEAQKITAIDSAEDAEEAARFGRLLQVASKEVTEFFKGVKVQVDSIKKPILDAEKADLSPYDAEKNRLSALQLTWTQKCRKEQEERDRKARAEADAAAREEALLRAIEHESLGDIETAEAVLSEPIVAAPSVTLSRVTKPSGSVTSFKYSVELLNLMETIKAIAAGKAPIQSVKFDESWLNSKARLEKEAYSVPGTRLAKTENLHYRS